MKVRYILTFIIFIVLNSSVYAKEDDDPETQAETDATTELRDLQTELRDLETELRDKEAIVKEALRSFAKDQQSFEVAAAELRDATEASTQVLIQDNINEWIELSGEFIDQMVPLTLTFLQDQASWSDSLPGGGVIGVVLREATDSGVRIDEVVRWAPAHLAGVEAGDIIVRIDDADLSNLEDPIESTVELINSKKPGSVLRITLQRDSEELETDVATVDRISLNAIRAYGEKWQSITDEVKANDLASSSIGLLVSSDVRGTENMLFVMEIEEDFGHYFDVEYGVLVLKAEDVAGIQAGDILLEIDGKPVRSISHANRHKHQAGDEIEIRVKRKQREKVVTLEQDQFNFRTVRF